VILVIGGTGFIGKNLLIALNRIGTETISVSRQPDLQFLEAHSPGTRALTVEQFISDPAAALFGCKAVVYLASISTPGANLEAPWREAQGTVEPLMRIMANVVQHSDAHFIYFSSGGTVYGPNDALQISEDAPLNPISPYGLGKKMSEAAVRFMADTHGLRQTILRPANPVGHWQTSRSQGVVGALLRAVQSDSHFPLIGGGRAIRDYIDVADLVDATLAVIEKSDKSVGQIWNVGSGQGHSVLELVEMVQQITGHQITAEPQPRRNSDVDRVVLDINRISEAIGWRATVPLISTLEKAWQALQ
jgi:UDP-glucose 4-epimerase